MFPNVHPKNLHSVRKTYYCRDSFFFMKKYKSFRPRMLTTNNLEMHLRIHAAVTKKNMPDIYRDLIILGLLTYDRSENGEVKEMLEKAREVYL